MLYMELQGKLNLDYKTECLLKDRGKFHTKLCFFIILPVLVAFSVALWKFCYREVVSLIWHLLI